MRAPATAGARVDHGQPRRAPEPARARRPKRSVAQTAQPPDDARERSRARRAEAQNRAVARGSRKNAGTRSAARELRAADSARPANLRRGRYDVAVTAGRSVAVAGGRAVSIGRAFSGVAKPAAAATRPVLRVVAGGIERIPSNAAAEPLARGRFLIVVAAILGAGLIYINVGKLEAGDGYGRYAASALELQSANTALRARIAHLSSSKRIQEQARALGLVMPSPEAYKWVHGKSSNAASLKAVRGYTAPTDQLPPQLPTVEQPQSATTPPATQAPATGGPVQTQTAPVPSATTPAAPAPTGANGTTQPGAAGGAAVQGQAGGQ